MSSNSNSETIIPIYLKIESGNNKYIIKRNFKNYFDIKKERYEECNLDYSKNQITFWNKKTKSIIDKLLTELEINSNNSLEHLKKYYSNFEENVWTDNYFQIENKDGKLNYTFYGIKASEINKNLLFLKSTLNKVEKLNSKYPFFVEGEYYEIYKQEDNNNWVFLGTKNISRKNFIFGIQNFEIDGNNIKANFFPSKVIKKAFLERMYKKLQQAIFSGEGGKLWYEEKIYVNYKDLYDDLKFCLSFLEKNIHKELINSQKEEYLWNIQNIDEILVNNLSKNISLKNGQPDFSQIGNKKLKTNSLQESINNYVNQVLKFMLNKILQRIQDIEVFNSSNYEIYKPKIEKLIYYFNNHFLQDVDNLEEFKSFPNKFFYDPIYKKIYLIYKKSNSKLKIFSSYFDQIDFVESITNLYEIYCYLELKDMLDIEGKDISKVINTSKIYRYENDIKYNKLCTRGLIYDFFTGKYIKKLPKKIDKSNIKFISDINQKNKGFIEFEKNTKIYKFIFGGRYCGENKNKYDFSNILPKIKPINNQNGLTPDIVIEIYNKGSNKPKNIIIFDVKFSAFWDEKNKLEYPRSEIFTEELHKYRLIYEIYGFNKDKPIFILYPGNIENIKKFKKLNDYIYSMYRMYLIPIFTEKNEIKEFVKNKLGF